MADTATLTKNILILDLEKSHRLIDIFIVDILNQRPADLTKLQYIKDFTPITDTTDPDAVLGKLLYYRFYQHGHYVDENIIANLLKITYKSKIKAGETKQLLGVFFSRAINNYIHTHLLHSVDGENASATQPIPERTADIIIKYANALIKQFKTVFDKSPRIALNDQYVNLKELETIDTNMYKIISIDGFNDEAEKLFMESWEIFIQIYTTPDGPEHIQKVKQELSTLTPEQCDEMIARLNPEKYDKLLNIMKKININNSEK